MPRRTGSVHLGIARLSVDPGTHAAFFWETPEEFRSAVEFLRQGERDGDHLVVFGHKEANERVLEALSETGLDCDTLQAEGRLSVLGPDSTGEETLGRIGTTFQSALDRGAGMVRLLGNIGWGRLDWPDETDLLRFEARVTSAAASFPCVVLCMYDLKSLSGSVVFHGAFCTHPVTVYRGNLVRENPMCVDVEEYLARLEARRHSA